MPQINTTAIGGTTDSESNFFYFLYLFRYPTLKQHLIKKLCKVIIGKTISKSSVSANKPAESLNLCSLPTMQLYTTKIKLVQIGKVILRLPKNTRCTHICTKMVIEIFLFLDAAQHESDQGREAGC